MNPIEWNLIPNKLYFYKTHLLKSRERFFVCECRFGNFKLRSALENVFLLEAHNCARVTSLKYESERVELNSLTPTGRRKSYIPDFLVNDEHLIECKAYKAQNDAEVLEKAACARNFCNDRGWLYHMLDYDDFSPFFELL